jgi:formylglycine-generating enzyme required for sulfatase activity
MRIFLLTILVFSSLFSLDRAMRLKMKSEPKVALLVGNSSYSKSNYFDKLKNPTNDVKRVAEKLRTLGFQVIEAHNISDLELQEKLKKFYSLLRSQKEGVGLFYFAGHGIEVNGINYLIPNDISVADESYVPYRSTPLNPIIESMNKTGKRLNIAVIDACRENPYTSTRNKKRGGLASFSASGTFIAYSAESGKLAHDGDGKLSPFAEAFVKNIETPQTIEQFFKAVRKDVYQKTDGEQTPMTHNLIRGDFYFKLPNEEELISAGGSSGKTTFTTSNEERDEFFLTVLNNVSNFQIRVDGNRFQNGDLLERGRYRVEVSKSGYETIQKNIKISKDTKFRVKMVKSKVSLTINPYPSDSRVYIMKIKPRYRDGILLERGKYQIKVKRTGYYTKLITVDLQSDSSFDVSLDKIGGSSGYVSQNSNSSSYGNSKNMGSYILPAMVLVKRGSFMMGSNSGDSDEKPVHRVNIDYDFYVGKYEVTIKEYMKFVEETNSNHPEWLEKGNSYNIKTGSNKNYYKKMCRDNNCPIMGVSWKNAKAYAEWLSRKSGKKFSLLSEAEWEYMARAGTSTKWSFGNSQSDLKNYAWYSSNSGSKTHEVGTKRPNPWGIYDVHGNVWEWVEDDFESSYQKTPKNGNSYLNNSERKSIRGGSWNNDPNSTRSANRDRDNSSYRNSDLGFRLNTHRVRISKSDFWESI